MPRLVLLALIILAAACSGGAAPELAASTRDSSGVTIVESPVAIWDDDTPWRVDSVPLLSIGSEGDTEAYMFTSIAGAVRRSDGSIVLAEAASRELRVFDAEGSHIGTFGRRGPGPGEFNSASHMSRCGADEIWVDSGSRISVWSLDSVKFLREFTLTDNAMWPLICFDGTALLVQQSRSIDPEQAPLNTPYTDSLLFKVMDSTGAPRATLFTLPLWEYMVVRLPEGGRGFLRPFGLKTVLIGNGRSLVVGMGSELRLDEYDLDGRWLRSLRGPQEDFALTQEWRDKHRSAPLARGDSMMRDWFVAVGSPYPDRVPAYDNLVRDRAGHLWVHLVSMPGSGENRWGVFAPDGRFMGHVMLPTGLHVLEIGHDYILGTERDDYNVPQVRLHRLVREAREPGGEQPIG